MELLNKTVHEASAAYRRRLFLSNLQEHLRHAYTSRYVQFFVMLAILGNVATEAAHLQLQPQLQLQSYHFFLAAFSSQWSPGGTILQVLGDSWRASETLGCPG